MSNRGAKVVLLLLFFGSTILASACATTQPSVLVPPAEFPAEGPQLSAGGLYAETPDKAPGSPILLRDGFYSIGVNQRCVFLGWVTKGWTASGASKIVKVFNKVDIWREYANGKTLNGSKTFEYDMDKIKDCCMKVWVPWWNSFAYDPGWFATFTMWVVDEAGRASNSVTLGPIVVRGGSTVPKAW